MLSITCEEAEARSWNKEIYAEEKESQDRSRNADYHFY